MTIIEDPLLSRRVDGRADWDKGVAVTVGEVAVFVQGHSVTDETG